MERLVGGITHTDLDTNEKIVIYVDVSTFEPVKVLIDFKGKPVEGEMTTKELFEDSFPSRNPNPASFIILVQYSLFLFL